ALELRDLTVVPRFAIEYPEVRVDPAIPRADVGDLLAVRRPARILDGVVRLFLRDDLTRLAGVLEHPDTVVLATILSRQHFGEEDAAVRFRGGGIVPRGHLHRRR